MTRPLVRVMVASRYDIERRGLRLIVEELDQFHIVGEAANGRDALTVAQETIPHIVILDICLPELNGLGLIHQIRRTNIPAEFVIYADSPRESLVVDALQAGVRGIVLKSEPSDHLVTALKSLSMHRPYFSSPVTDFLLNWFAQSYDSQANELTHREFQVIQLVAEGRLNKQIGHILDISVKTVECHRASAMRKLKLRTTADVVRYAIRSDIVPA